jgi:hypothetical protein
MKKDLSEGSLGDIYKSVLGIPLQMVKLPYKSYKTHYGTHTNRDQYTGSFSQKQKLKNVLKSLHKGENLSNKDRLFMDMVNRFMTEQGRIPMDQSGVDLKCQNCKPYIFVKDVSKKSDVSHGEEPKEEEPSITQGGVYSVRFDSELKPKETEHVFRKGNTYKMVVIKTYRDRGFTYIHIKNSFLEDNDFLIFKTQVKNPLNEPHLFKCYQDNSETPLKTPTKLGPVIVKIF